ncbi:LLM class flavin-dependent oxidoreductase [Microbulbifer agarilyticus]
MISGDHKMEFQTINRAYNQTYRPNRLSLGLVVPIENSGASAVPQMLHHLERVQLAEALGFSAVWRRDVPFNVPSFGDAGQLFAPFVYLGYLAGNTKDIALGVASIVLPLRHPAHVAKSAASADVLSNGRVLLGVASGDRPEEYPAFNKSFESRAESFRSSIDYINRYLSSLQAIGINHVALNLRFNQADIESTLKRLAEEVLPDFS